MVTVAVFDHETEDFVAHRYPSRRRACGSALLSLRAADTQSVSVCRQASRAAAAGAQGDAQVRPSRRGAEHDGGAVRGVGGSTEEDNITLRRWMEQRPLHGSRSFLDFMTTMAIARRALRIWEADYQTEMAAAGLSR
jgi:hypothetical protein